MPGFQICGRGGNGQPSNTVETRRPSRWKFLALSPAIDTSVLLHLASASRPSIKFEEDVMHHQQERAYFAGLHTFNDITISFYDVQNGPDMSAQMYRWVGSVLDLNNVNVDVPVNYKRDAKLAMLDGFGNPTEIWSLCGTWPVSTNWKDLDYSKSDICQIEVTIRFDRATRESVGSGGGF